MSDTPGPDALDEYADWAGESPPDHDQPDQTDPPAPEGITPLGYGRKKFFYYSCAARQVVDLRASEHTELPLRGLASGAHWWERSQFVGDRGVIKWSEAADWLMTECRNLGIFDADKIRGRGAWIDDGRTVLHVGDCLLVDGQRAPLELPRSKFIYEAGKRLGDFRTPPLSTAEAHKFLQICRRLSWDRGISATLAAGFVVVAPICGGLHWRPSCWMTGASDSGKTWINMNIVRPMLAGVSLLVQGQTTEPGLRQALWSDALPVMFEEAEAEERGAEHRVAAILGLLRTASSDFGASIIKGAQQQDGAKLYRIRSSFWFSSINVSVVHRADESRITILSVGGRKLPQDAFRALERDTEALITPAYASGLVARSVRLLPAIRANAGTFRDALALHLGTNRTGDQIGTLLAGAYSLHSTGLISPADALAYVQRQEWDAVAPAKGEAETDEQKLLVRITQSRVRITGGQDTTIERLIRAAWGLEGGWLMDDVAERELRSLGIRSDAAGIFVSNTHPAMARLLVDTPWVGSWARSLQRLPGAEIPTRTIKFGSMAAARAVYLPRATLEQVTGDD